MQCQFKDKISEMQIHTLNGFKWTFKWTVNQFTQNLGNVQGHTLYINWLINYSLLMSQWYRLG